MKLLGGYIGFTPSVRPSVHPSVPHPVSAPWCIHFWLDPFHIYTSYQATSEGVSCLQFLAKLKNLNFGQIFIICNFDFVVFWLGIWCESLVWAVMGRRGVPQNAGILVVLVLLQVLPIFFTWLHRPMNLISQSHDSVGPVSSPWFNGTTPLVASEVKFVLLAVLCTLVM